MASVSGDISLMSVRSVASWIAEHKLTCNLTVRRRDSESSFLIREGLVWQSPSKDPREYLGQHLINFGYIDETQLQRAFETQRETKVPLGRVLVMVDAITTQQLERVLTFKARESLLESMCWTDGEFRVVDHVIEDRELDVSTPIDLREVNSESHAREDMWTEIRKVFPSDATYCSVTRPADVKLGTFDQRLLEFLEGGHTIGEAALDLRAMDFQIYARVYDLYHRGIVAPTEPSAAEMLLSDFDEPSGSIEVGDSDVIEAAEATAQTKQLRHALQGMPDTMEEKEVALRVALAGRNWDEALLIADRILEVDAQNAEAIAARRVAEVQVRKRAPDPSDVALTLEKVASFAVPRAQVQNSSLTSKERYVLSRIDGRRTLKQIAAVSPIKKEELLRIVQGFVDHGTLKLDE